MRLNDLTQAITKAAAPQGMTTKIVVIDGGGGAGKSTLAGQLADAIDGAMVIHCDDFIPGPTVPSDWWHRLRDEVAIPLSQNQQAHYRRYDWGQHALAEWHDVEPGGVVIIEGVESMRLRPFAAYAIWIQTPEDIRIERGVARGNEDMGQWQKWMISDRKYVEEAHPQAAADVIIDGTKPVG